MSNRKGATKIRFDDSLRLFVTALHGVLGREAIESGLVIRDASGRLSFASFAKLDEDSIVRARSAVTRAGKRYVCDREFSVVMAADVGLDTLVADRPKLEERVAIRKGEFLKVTLLDNRIVGGDWLVKPADGWKPGEPARVVFASMKGGVGRSTALAVLATDLASKGRKVLVLDLDLEAPGIGNMLLETRDKPQFGALDWFVERRLTEDTDDLLLEMVAPSVFAEGTGLINVVPAVGASSDTYPENVLAKISRAYLDQPGENGAHLTFLDRARLLVAQLAKTISYDAILIDARAGLNESTSASLLGLGADVLLFGVNTPQTFTSYRYLLAHLARFPRQEDDDWLYRLRMIHAHASPESANQAEFRDRAYKIFSDHLYGDVPLLNRDGNPMAGKSALDTIEQFSVDDPTGPHFAWPILWDSTFSEFDPLAKRSQLTSEYYIRTYEALLKGISNLINPLPEGV